MPYYPIHDFGPLMKGMVIGGMGIFHVFLAQFAIGGGILMAYFQWLAQSGREPLGRVFLDSYFKVLVLVSFVLGALTGVGMWLTTIQVSAPTIGLMLQEFHWFWATEWTFFALEVVAGYTFYRYGGVLRDRDRMGLLVLYAVAAWFSLFWINGILAWQLTPGAWLTSGSAWAGFFNASFWPSLLYRTIAAVSIAALVGVAVINGMDLPRAARHRLVTRVAPLLLPMLVMPALGGWFLAVMPADSRGWVLGGSVAMTLFLNLTVGASLLIGLYACVGLFWQRLYINGATAALLCALAFGATAGGEFVREGVRKPYTVRQVLYSNALRPDDVARLRERGSVRDDPYPLRDAAVYPTDQLRLGAKVFRFQCSVCHTEAGANGLVHLAGTWGVEQRRFNIAHLQ
ncbi:MAG TPA: cytochrome BD quinol oxidase subunit I, partial [Myxococcota bacterium]|nr:cytochrome BD quinol oxidase subunit I [Myxococcota bacterium]